MTAGGNETSRSARGAMLAGRYGALGAALLLGQALGPLVASRLYDLAQSAPFLCGAAASLCSAGAVRLSWPAPEGDDVARRLLDDEDEAAADWIAEAGRGAARRPPRRASKDSSLCRSASARVEGAAPDARRG